MLVIAGLATVFMHRWLRPGYTSLPLNLESAILPWHQQVVEPHQNLLISDPFYIFYPARRYLTESLRRGTLPLWNPYIFGGHPVLGDTNTPNYYPFNLLAALLLAPERALPILAWLHVILSGTLMYVFLRTLELRPEAALLGSVSWMLSEFTVVWLESPEKLSTLAWMPGVFACFKVAVRRRRLTWAIIGGLPFGLQILGGQTQIALYSAMLLGLYAVFHVLSSSWTQRRLDVWPVVALAIIGVMGTGVGAVQFSPTYQLVKLGHRIELPQQVLLSTRWPLRHLVTLWLPDFFGNALRYDYRSVANFVETAAYFGIAPALLCFMSLFVNRHRSNWFAGGLFVSVLLIAGGTRLARVAVWVPGFRYFNLSRLAGLLAFPGAIMAAMAAHAVSALSSQHQKRLIWGGLVAVSLMALITGWVVSTDPGDVAQHWTVIRADLVRTLVLVGLVIVALAVVTRWPRVGLAGLLLLTFADLYQWGEPFNPVHSTDILYPENEVVDLLRQDNSLYRALPLKTDWIIFGPNVLSVFDIAEVGGYTSLTVQRYQELIRVIDPGAETGSTIAASRFSPLYSMLNVKYVLSAHSLPTVVELARYEGCTSQTKALVNSDYFQQSFVTQQAGLNRIDVMLAHVGQVGNQPVRFRLWHGDVGDELVADITNPANELPDRGPSIFFFAPVSDSIGDRFTWRVEAPEARPDATVAICLTDDVQDQTASFVAYGAMLQHIDLCQNVWIYQNPNVLPRAYIVHHAEVASGKQALEVLQSPQFNMYRTVVLDEPLPPDQSASLSPTPIRSDAQAHITSYGAHRIDIQVQTPSPGILALSDVYYPGWRASIDEQPAQVFQVNHALRGIYLPAGSHAISFFFRPITFYAGLATTSVATLLIIAIVSVKILRQMKSKKRGLT